MPGKAEGGEGTQERQQGRGLPISPLEGEMPGRAEGGSGSRNLRRTDGA